MAGRERILGPGHADARTIRANLDQARRDADRRAGPSQASAEAASSPAGPIPPSAEQLSLDQPSAGSPAPEAVAEEAAVAAVTVEDKATAREEAEAGSSAAEEVAAGDSETDTSGGPALMPVPAPEPEMSGLHPPAAAGRPAISPRAHRPVRLLWVAAAILALLAAGGAVGAVGALSRLHSGDHSPVPVEPVRSKPANAAQLAADWVSRQVSHGVTVACDPLMCAALEARGVPTARLLVLRSGAPSPRGAGVVVATPAVRSQFGSRLDSEYAPSVIAGFGSGPGQVNVQVVAPDGAAAYRAALRRDQADRKEAGTQLLANQRIGMMGQARAELAAGAVDSRLLILLPALAATHPIQVLAFGDAGPQAGPGSPVCSADLSGSGWAAGLTDAAYQRWLISFIRAQPAHFTGSVVIARRGGQAIVRVQFSQPSPLGLLSAT